MVSTRTMAQLRASTRRMGAILPLKRYNSAGVSPTERGRVADDAGPRGTRTWRLDGQADDPDILRLVLYHGRLLSPPLVGAPLRGGGRRRELRRGAREGGVHALDRARPGLDASHPGGVRLLGGSGTR